MIAYDTVKHLDELAGNLAQLRSDVATVRLVVGPGLVGLELDRMLLDLSSSIEHLHSAIVRACR